MLKEEDLNKFILIFVILFIFMTSLCLAQRCYWYTYGASGQAGDDFGSTTGQTSIAHFSHEGDSISYGFWLLPWDPVLCVSVSDSFWYVSDISLSDTVDMAETRSMELGDVIEVYNCSNCWVDYGLRWDDSGPSSLEIGYLPATDRGVVRAQFRSDGIRPTLFSVSNDYVKPSISWANNEVFGPGGHNIAASETQNFWLQFLSPTDMSSSPEPYYIIPIIILTKMALP